MTDAERIERLERVVAWILEFGMYGRTQFEDQAALAKVLAFRDECSERSGASNSDKGAP